MRDTRNAFQTESRHVKASGCDPESETAQSTATKATEKRSGAFSTACASLKASVGVFSVYDSSSVCPTYGALLQDPKSGACSTACASLAKRYFTEYRGGVLKLGLVGGRQAEAQREAQEEERQHDERHLRERVLY